MGSGCCGEPGLFFFRGFAFACGGMAASAFCCRISARSMEGGCGALGVAIATGGGEVSSAVGAEFWLVAMIGWSLVDDGADFCFAMMMPKAMATPMVAARVTLIRSFMCCSGEANRAQHRLGELHQYERNVMGLALGTSMGLETEET